MKSIIPEAESEFQALMLKETGQEKYQSKIVILEGDYIDPESISGKCGGVILMNQEQTITCFNTLDSRL